MVVSCSAILALLSRPLESHSLHEWQKRFRKKYCSYEPVSCGMFMQLHVFIFDSSYSAMSVKRGGGTIAKFSSACITRPRED
eukprot:6199416-Pleurochrysis_carterae.AAC.1